jgi:trigger factor
MKSTKNVKSTSIEFEVTFDQNDFEPARLKALERLARNIKVPGFRNGKAPANVVEQHVDPNELASTTLDILVRQAIPKLFDGSGVTPVSIPRVDIKKFIPGEMAELVVAADILPEVQLGDYKKLKGHYDKPEVSDDDVEDVLRRIADSYAESKVVKRKAKNGDEVIIDFVGKKDGVAFDGGSAKDFRLRLGSGAFIPGFEDGIIGHESGDKFDLNLTFPKDYGNTDLAGAKTVFEVLVKQVNEIVAPAIDDELAKKSGAFATLKELRDDIKKNLLAQAEHNADEHFKDDLLTALVDSSKTEAPASLVEEQSDHIKEDLARNLQTRGQKMEDFLAARGQSQEEWEEEVKKTAERRVMSSIIVQKLSDELKIEVSEDEINQQVAEMLTVYKNDPKASEQLATPEARNSIANRLRINKTMDKLAEINRPHAVASKKAAKKPAAKKPAKKAKK